MDDDQLGEFAYDYVELRRDYLAWSNSCDPETAPRDRFGTNEHSDMLNPRKDAGVDHSQDAGSGQTQFAQGARHAIVVEGEGREKDKLT
jgi:Amt family ammonium transporter